MCTQIFVEIERARLTRRLAAIQEADGQIQEAADTMQEVPVVSGAAHGAALHVGTKADWRQRCRLCREPSEGWQPL
jgi:hypothetical protein